jgi:nitrous oxidase accessory protein
MSSNATLLPAVAFVAAVLSALDAAGAVHTVAQGESIADALRRVAPGDTVRLTGTEYRENLVIDVPIVLAGEGLPTIRGGYQGHVIHVTAPGTVLDGLHVSEAAPLLTKDMACILVEADSVTVRNSVITESLHGIYVKGGSAVEISGNRIQGRLDLIEADRGNGIHLWNSENNRVVDNEIFDVRDGIYFSFAHNTDVERNHVHHVRYGLHYMYSNQNSFSDNRFENNVAGAALMYSENILFSRNSFARCRGYRAYGILLQSMKNVTATSNLVLDNSRGIFLNNADGNRFEHNDVVDNDLAIQLNGGCDDNLFVRNNFLDNLSELLLDVSDRGTRWADESAGNYWSRYRGYDLDRDGVGDVPFNIQNVFQVMETRVPEVRFYLLSPAASLLETAERALPILNLGNAQDPMPLMQSVGNLEVPWDAAGTATGRPSPLWAALFLAAALAPPGILAFVSRVGRKRTSRKPGGAS